MRYKHSPDADSDDALTALTLMDEILRNLTLSSSELLSRYREFLGRV